MTKKAIVRFYKVSSANQRLDFPRFDEIPNKYVIASQPRCGSHLIGQLLYRTGAAGCPLEYFHARHWREWCARCKTKNPEYVSTVLMRRRTSENGIFGVKMHWDHFALLVKLGLETSFRDAKFVYLTRDDLLGQAISHVIALQTGQWVSGQVRQKDPIYSYEQIDRSIAVILKQRRNWEMFFCLTGIAPFRLTYESFLDDRRAHTVRLLEFIGIREQTLAADIPLDPIVIQRTKLNEIWRQRFLDTVAIKDADESKWRSVLEEQLMKKPKERG